MFAYIARRLMLMIPTLFGISVLIFGLIQVVPGGPVDNIIRQLKMGSGASGGNASVQISDELRKQLEKQFGFDKPIYIRYALWIKDVLTLKFGESYEYQEPVLDVIKRRIPISLSFGIWSLFLSYMLCIPLGVYKALKDGQLFDAVTSFALFTFYSIPVYALAILLIVFLGGGTFWDLFPIQGLHADDADTFSTMEYILDYLHHLALPLFCYVVGQFAALTLLMKNSFLEQISQDYVRTARAKGLPAHLVNFKHVLRNALIPIATGLGQYVGIFLTGSILIEKIFGLEGIGLLNFESILARDYPVVLTIIMLAALASVCGNFVSDMLYVIINPKVHFD